VAAEPSPETTRRLNKSRIRIPKQSGVRKPAAKPRPTTRPEPIQDIDIDALLAPLLSEIAAKHSDAQPTPAVAADAASTFAADAAPVDKMADPPALEATTPSTPLTRSAPSAPLAPSAPIAPVAPSAPEVDPMFFADDAETPPPPTPEQSERSAWIELVNSLRQDIERLKAERVEAAPPVVEETPPSIAARAISSIRRRPAADVVPMPSVAARAARLKPRRPVEDQWGLFDPEQCGFQALLAKLDEIGARDEVSA
jgi:hypothetical protein